MSEYGKVSSVPLNQPARDALIVRARFRATHCPAALWVFCNHEGQRIASIKKASRQRCVVPGWKTPTPMICGEPLAVGWCKLVFRFRRFLRYFGIATFGSLTGSMPTCRQNRCGKQLRC